MAPEVVACETIKDEPYGVKADIWSAGITLIEMADMFPPYHETNPMRVLIRITRSPPPMLAIPQYWSKEINDFIAKCLVKSPAQRPESKDLLNHSFINSVTDMLPLRLLYHEVRAPVEETIEDLPEDIAAEKESDSVSLICDGCGQYWFISGYRAWHSTSYSLQGRGCSGRCTSLTY